MTYVEHCEKKLNYKNLKRLICTVCGEFQILEINFECEYDITFLLKYNKLLNVQNLVNYSNDFNFSYDYPYDQLNSFVLDKCGFNLNKKTVYIFFILF